MRKFSSSLDQTSIVMTILMIGITLSVFVTGYISYRKSAGEPMVLAFTSLTAVFLTLIIVALYILRTTAISIDDTKLTIERPVKSVSIPFSEIKSIQLLHKGDMGLAIRTFGNGGVFGYTGMYYSKQHGSMTWYCTKRSGYIIIERNSGKKLVITPDDSSAVLDAINNIKPGLVTGS